MTRTLAGILLLMAILGAAFWVFPKGSYGLTMFILLPALIGAFGAAIRRPATEGGAIIIGALTAIAATFLLLFVGMDGLICIAMAAPLTGILGGIGGLLAYKVEHSERARRGAAMLLLLPPAGVTWDLTAQPDVYQVQTSIEISAPPERVWKHIVSLSELPPPTEWIFKTGIAYPTAARLVGSTRYCDFSTGPVVEPIEIWDAPHVLQFRVTETPAPMKEWSPYGGISPKHLHGYMISKRGRFELTPLPNNRTLLKGTSWYQHGLWPGQYWRWWSDAISHQVHLRVFHQIQMLAEGER